MNVADGIALARHRAEQLGWEKFDFEKKMYRIAYNKPAIVASNGGDEFFIFLSPEGGNNTFYQFGIIESERGWFFGTNTNSEIQSNFEFSGKTILSTETEGVHTCTLLRVFQNKP